MAKHYDKQFKLDAIRYYHDHRELGLQGCASNLCDAQDALDVLKKPKSRIFTINLNRITVLPKSHKCYAKQEKLFPSVLLGST